MITIFHSKSTCRTRHRDRPRQLRGLPPLWWGTRAQWGQSDYAMMPPNPINFLTAYSHTQSHRYSMNDNIDHMEKGLHEIRLLCQSMDAPINSGIAKKNSISKIRLAHVAAVAFAEVGCSTKFDNARPILDEAALFDGTNVMIWYHIYSLIVL